jgi:hypothetical protein
MKVCFQFIWTGWPDERLHDRDIVQAHAATNLSGTKFEQPQAGLQRKIQGCIL